ncbi:SusC/RagA family TonB-linked outer membrane protein [Leeuwenhoekiella polynyae]|uniref:TonB-linked SusC/RagA family outer membrane protein n=1 Tax=Leeuwenhoekiella polynyae TaxID=1550906 RepID=A0A4Q0NPN1_9FLAO|nr:SusC/RagA family TonB-linked outer membrane protein [Leeuwenhoekiella polynyae]RXG11467.1 TonB-linked SusC/RagA family outer membrane protein [Leeuwenhoekiella polynyae]
MKSKITWCFALGLLFLSQLTFAQQKTITGTVTDPDGMPLPGVNILVENTNTGTQTDFDGNYQISASQGDVLVFSYVGFQRQQITVGSSNTYSVSMEAGEALDEVVVVGYGTSTREAFAGTASTIKAEDIELKNYANVTQALAGESAGVSVINTSGQPGNTSTVRIRGFGSVNGNRAPLYVVDGVPLTTTAFDANGDAVSTGSLNAINPNDIKSTTILKDASATAIYGSRGANGVVLITTKSGSSSKDFIEVDVKTGINMQLLPRYDVIRSPEESIGLVWEAKVNRERLNGNPDPESTVNNTLFNGIIAPGYNMWNVADGAELIDPATGQVRAGVTRRYTPRSYEDASFNSAYRTEVNLRMGGGDEKSKYYISGGYLDDDGYAINTGYKRYNTRINVNSQLKDWLNVGANLGYTYSESLNNGQTDGAENLFEFADKMNPFYPVFLRDDNYQLVPDPIFGGFQYDYGSNSGFRERLNSNNLNPIASALYDVNGNDRNEVIGSFNATLDIVEGLTFETTFGLQYYDNVFTSMGNQFYGVATANSGDLFIRDTKSTTTNFLQLLRYKKDFGAHSFEVLAAHESNDFSQTLETTYKAKAIIPQGLELDNYIINLQQPTGFTQGRTLESYFAQLNYDFDNRYYLTASVRRDGSSRFANDKWDTFGSVGAAWVVSNEDFLFNNDFISFLKLKGSFGITGDESGVDYYTGINTFQVTNLNDQFAVAPELFANPDLTWETAKQYQVGLEFGLGSYIDATVDYFIKDTDNLIFDRRISPSSGVATITVNDGVLRNSGLEFDVTGHILKTSDISLDLSVNGAIYDNEIRTMPIDPETQEPSELNIVGRYGYSQGSSIFDFYIREYAGVDPEDGFPMWNQYFDDANGNGVLDTGETSIISLTQYLGDNPDANVASQTTKTYANATQKDVGKSGIPDIQGAFRLNAGFYNFNLSAQFTYSVGGWGYDSQYAELMHDNNGGIAATNRHTDVRNRWRQPGDITSVPLIADRVIPNVNSTSTRFLTKTDFIALNNVVLGYTFNKPTLDRFGLSGLNIYASGDNLYFKGARDGFNPTTSEDGNSERGLYAPLTTFTIGVRAKF